MNVYLPFVAAAHGRDRLVADLLALMRSHAEQRRQRLDVHPTLMAAAQAKADDMVRRGYYSHVDPEGVGPNDYVRRYGYRLPSNYPGGASNSIESLDAGPRTADEVWQRWLGSPGHRRHMLALHDAYTVQTQVGAGWADAPDAWYRNIWVLFTCPEESA